MDDQELLELLTQLSTSDEELTGLDDQMKQADLLRNMQTPGATQVGRVVSPNIATNLATAFLHGKGERMATGLQDQRASVLDKQRRGRKAYGQAIMTPEQKMQQLGLDDDALIDEDQDFDYSGLVQFPKSL